jgi:hypothetical protein
MPPLDAVTAGLEAKRTAALLRDARAVLRKIDVLAATAATAEDPALGEVSVVRHACAQLVRHLERRMAGVQRRSRQSVRGRG